MPQPLSLMLYCVKIYKLFEFNKACALYGECVGFVLFIFSRFQYNIKQTTDENKEKY